MTSFASASVDGGFHCRKGRRERERGKRDACTFRASMRDQTVMQTDDSKSVRGLPEPMSLHTRVRRLLGSIEFPDHSRRCHTHAVADNQRVLRSKQRRVNPRYQDAYCIHTAREDLFSVLMLTQRRREDRFAISASKS